MKLRNRNNLSIGEIVFDVFKYLFIITFCIFVLYPILLVISVSFSDELSVQLNGYKLIPQKFSFDTYKYLFEASNWIFSAYSVSFFVTIVGTLCCITATAMLAYAISVKNIKYGRQIAMYCFITMIISSGMVPWYITLTKYYKLGNKIFALILPYLINPWLLFLLRNFFKTIPSELRESGKIDGASDFKIFIKIILPLSVPGLATVSLFYALAFWNDWWLSLMFISKRSLYPLQYHLYSIISDVMFLASSQAARAQSADIKVPLETVKMATTEITIGPIILVYPFVQKYFVKGLLVGSIKG